MARPPAKELTERELEIMQVVWRVAPAVDRGARPKRPRLAANSSPAESADSSIVGITAAEVRDLLAEAGLDRAYTTIATLVRILLEKGFLEQLPGDDRPFRYRAARSYEDVSGRLLGDLIDRVFGGSREMLLVRLLGEKKLSAKERAVLEQLLREERP